jgi:hypothetical protein
VPYVKRIKDTVGIPQVIAALHTASRQISEAMGAMPQAQTLMKVSSAVKPNLVKIKK